MQETPPHDHVVWEDLEGTFTKDRRNIIMRRAPVSETRADDGKALKNKFHS